MNHHPKSPLLDKLDRDIEGLRAATPLELRGAAEDALMAARNLMADLDRRLSSLELPPKTEPPEYPL